MIRPLTLTLASITFTTFLGSLASGAFSNPTALALGDRASGMGGAATALTGDIAAGAFYNPAVLSRSPGQSFSASASVYKKFDTIYGGDADYLKTPLRINTGYFRSIPASTGSIVTFGDYKVGLSIVVPDYDVFKGDLKNTDTEVSTLSYTDESLWVGGAIATNIDETSSVGLTLYYTARNFQRSMQDKTYSAATLTQLFTSEETLQQNAIVAILGYYKLLSPSLAVGVSLRTPGLSFHSNGTYFEDEVTGGTSTSRINENSLTAPNFIPGKAALGIAWGHKDGWTVTADVTLHEGFSYRSLNYQNKGSYLNYEPVWNYAIGVEKKWYDWLKLRAGLFSNYSAHPNPNPNIAEMQGERVDQAGFAANVNFISGKKVSYTFGGYWTGGRGRAITRTDQVYSVSTKTQNIFTMLVGTSFYF